jgi:hypothetical protein
MPEKTADETILDKCTNCSRRGGEKFHCDECGADHCDECNNGSGCCPNCGVAIEINKTEDSVSTA